MGSTNGRGDEGVGSNWSGRCYSPVEFPAHVAHVEGEMGMAYLKIGGGAMDKCLHRIEAQYLYNIVLICTWHCN